MPSFDLYLKTDAAALTAELQLCDLAGNQLDWRLLQLRDYPPSRWEGLFDLRRYVHRYAGNLHPLGVGAPLGEADLLRELGDFLGRQVLGPKVMRHLGRGIQQRSVRVHLPPGFDDLASAFARVPWEIARAGTEDRTLAEKNVHFRALGGAGEPRAEPLQLDPGEALRVLLVFAEAPGSRPLAARLERRQLLELFHRQIYPHRRVEVDVLCHGVTRERLRDQIQDRGGYHILHWSGHGNLNRLELYAEGKEPRDLTGQGLVDLFEEAGGYVPRLVFLSACHSGNFLNIKDWTAFQAVLEGNEPGLRHFEPLAGTQDLSERLQEQPGYTGTGRALLEAGIPTIIATRYEVGDDYARDLAREFYQRLLADQRPKRPDEALNQARRALLEVAQGGEGHGYTACDHATPLLYGTADPRLTPLAGSTPLPVIRPRLRIADLRPHRDFVGRSLELAGLGARWVEARGERPVALVRGIAGLGKTALAAEAIGLWSQRFRWVFAFEAKPVALPLDVAPPPLDDFLQHFHERWLDQQSDYAREVIAHPNLGIWRPATAEFTGAKRHEVLRENVLAALCAEPVLLVVDNFEPNLKPQSGARGHECQDPSWDALLTALSEGLAGSRSRLLVTSRWPIAALADEARLLDVPLGPLPPGESALYVQGHTDLRRLHFEQGDAGRALVKRVLHASRGHPLLLDRLGRLAAHDPGVLEEALEKLEQEGLSKLPEFFAADPKDENERAYLDDALTGSIDLLLAHVGPNARHALWVLSLASEPVTFGLWLGVWEGGALADDGSAATALGATSLESLRRMLVQSGLVTESREDEADPVPEYNCHEVVRERIAEWIKNAPPEESGDRTREGIWSSYGERLVLAFQDRVANNRRSDAAIAGARALRYVARANAWDQLPKFVDRLVLSTKDPTLLRILLPELQTAARDVPPGRLRAHALCALADALDNANDTEASLPHYQAAAADAEGDQDWDALAHITGNWAGALANLGNWKASLEKRRESTHWRERAGVPAGFVLSSKVEELGIRLALDEPNKVLREIESALEQLRRWWQQTERGEPVPEFPHRDALRLALMNALHNATHAHCALEQWQPALDRIDEWIALQRSGGESEHAIATTRFSRYGPLLRLGKLDEAQRELQSCLEVFDQVSDILHLAKTLLGLADMFDENGDVPQAVALQRRALDLFNTLPNPVNRATSHNNLANYLEAATQPEEVPYHELAALLYWITTGHRQNIAMSIETHMFRIRRARESGTDYRLPRVAELLARPDFAALRDWLAERQVNLDDIQRVVDVFVAKCRDTVAQECRETP